MSAQAFLKTKGLKADIKSLHETKNINMLNYNLSAIYSET